MGDFTFSDSTITGYTGAETDITIPSMNGATVITTIGPSAFVSQGITSVTIPSSITTIGDNAFGDCMSLVSVSIPSSVTTIGNGAFVNCYALTSITIPSSVSTIGDNAFDSCTGLSSVSFSAGLTVIGIAAFNSTALTSVSFPAGLLSIGIGAFDACNLTAITFQPGPSITIGDDAFRASSFSSVSLPAGSTSVASRYIQHKGVTQYHGSFPAGATILYFGVPGAPTSVSATAGNTQATVSFVAPADNGGVAITSYTVTSSPGGFAASGSTSPILVTGLSNGTAYTFTARATNSVGVGSQSSASSAVTPSSGGVRCFTRGTLIRTPSGEVAVEELTQGDLVTTASGLIVPIKGVYTTHVEKTSKENAPYLIPAGTYGPAQPKELILSPTHAFQIRKSVWMVPAVASLMNPVVHQIYMGEPVEYYHLECPIYLRDNLIANDCIVESFGLHQIKKCPYTFSKRLGGFTRSSIETHKCTKY